MNLRPVSSFRILALLAVITGNLPGTRLHAETSFDSISQEVQAIFNRSKSAVVKIEASDEHGQLCGTGFFIDPNGTLFTAYTIGGESHDIVVSDGEKKWMATRLLGDSRSGIAILKVEARTPYLPLGKTDSLTVTSPVMTIGYPMDFGITPNFGIIGGFDIKHLDRFFAATHIRANVPVQRGEGGSPLLNMKGEVIGILISCIDNGAGCFALPIEAAEKVQGDYMRFGEMRPGWLGLSLTNSPEETGGSVAKIDRLVEGEPGEKSGLQIGDVLIGIGQRKIKCIEDMINAAFYLTSGDEVPLTVLRNNKPLTVKVQAVDHPSLHREMAGLPTPSIPGIPLKQDR